MINWLNRVDFFLLILLYCYFIYLGVRYFKKSDIEDPYYFNTIKYLGVSLIIIIVYLAFSANENVLLISFFEISIIFMSFYLLISATFQHTNQPLNFAFSKSIPSQLTTDGVYRNIRHPIYTAYILGWIAGFLKTQNLTIIPLIMIMVFVYIKAIKKEEGEFLNSDLSEYYKNYMKRTKRLIPFIY